MAKNGLAARLYRGEADLNIVGRRNLWFGVAGVLVLVAVLSFAISGFKLGIEFAGGNTFQVPASVGTLDRAEQVVDEVLADEAAGVEVVSAQKVGSTSGEFYEMRTGQLSAEQCTAIMRMVRCGAPGMGLAQSAGGRRSKKKAVTRLLVRQVSRMVSRRSGVTLSGACRGPCGARRTRRTAARRGTGRPGRCRSPLRPGSGRECPYSCDSPPSRSGTLSAR